jgi:beta-glucosidase/6-phospho-beta-glucosidase/beta-galactosidase
MMLSETSRVSSRAVEWLSEQWRETGRLVDAGVPVHGFTWFPLGDVVDWRHALREKRGDIDPIGLYSMNRDAHSVATAYAGLIACVVTGDVRAAQVVG